MKQDTLMGKIRLIASKAVFATKLPGSIALGSKIMPASSKESLNNFVESTVALKKASIAIVARLSSAYPAMTPWFRDDTVSLLPGGHLLFSNAMVVMGEFLDDATINRVFQNFVQSFETFEVVMKYFQAVPSYLVTKGYMDATTGLLQTDVTPEEMTMMYEEMARIMADWMYEAKIQMWTYDELVVEFTEIFSKGKYVQN